MIVARKHAAFNFVLRRLLAGTLRRRFHNVYVCGREHLSALDRERPVVGCVNHTNWWDGFVLYVLSARLLPHEIYLAMAADNLQRYPFFPWMGVFGIDAAAPGRAIRYGVRLLRGRREGQAAALIWMFVQGRLLPPDVPIKVKPGALLLARQSGAALLPVALRYEWLSESRPTIFVNVARPLPADTTAGELAASLQRLNEGIPTVASDPGIRNYAPLYKPRMSMNKLWEYVSHRRDKFESQNR